VAAIGAIGVPLPGEIGVTVGDWGDTGVPAIGAIGVTLPPDRGITGGWPETVIVGDVGVTGPEMAGVVGIAVREGVSEGVGRGGTAVVDVGLAPCTA